MAALTRSALALVALVGCRGEKAPAPPPAAASVSAKPVDRLAPGELAPGDSQVFGLGLPRGMRVDGRYHDYALAVGELPADGVANFVRDQVVAEHVEIGAARTVFPSVRIKKGAADRTYRIEVQKDGAATRLVVRDVTPPPPVKVEGLSPDELWRRAGFTRDGKPLNPKTLE